MRDAIVVGASAGGIRALTQLLRGVPADLPAAILTVVHIPAHSPSALPRILSDAGPLPARAAEDGEPLVKGRIYVAPPDRHLVVERDRLRLTRGPRENRARPAIDALFRSAAVELGPRVIGVVLSGVLDDGTAGLWAVKDRGGVAIVQQPAEAEHPDMPRNALEHVAIDHVLPTAQIGPKLAALAAEPAPALRPPPAAMAVEAKVQTSDAIPGAVITRLGQPSKNSCPECHGSLAEIREGSIVRYRCHTGHSYSLQTLLADTEVDIEKSLWSAVRAIDEQSFLLRTMEQRAREAGDSAAADRLVAEAERAEANASQLRRLTTGQSAL